MSDKILTTQLKPSQMMDEVVGNYNGTTVRMPVDLFGAQIDGTRGPNKETRADLFSDLNWRAGFVGKVWGDDNIAQRGVYTKLGGPGAGSWFRIGPLPEDSSGGGVGTGELLALASGRPGEASRYWTHQLVGSPTECPPIEPGLVVVDSEGSAVRIVGAHTLAGRLTCRLEAGRKYRVRFVVRRRVNPANPAVDTVQCRLRFLTSSQEDIVAGGDAQLALLNNLTVASGRREVSVVVSMAADTGVDVVAPAGTIYARGYIRTLGTLCETDVEMVAWDDVTDTTVLASDVSAVGARVTSFETLDVGTRLDNLEAQVDGAELRRFLTRSALAAETISETVDAVEVLRRTTTAPFAPAIYVRVGANPGHAASLQSVDGTWWERANTGQVQPEEFGAPAVGDATTACQAALDYLGKMGGGTLVLNKQYQVTNLTMRDGVSLRGLHRDAGFSWLQKPLTNAFNTNVSVTLKSKSVTIAGNVLASVAEGRVFRLAAAQAIYIVAKVDLVAGNTVITLNRPWLGASSASVAAIFHDPFGMLEWPDGPTTGVNLHDITLDGNAINPGGFVVYRAARKGGFTSGGDWLGTWLGVRIVDCCNGMWLRGTLTAPANNSVEPVQFHTYVDLQIERSANTDGTGLAITGQVNQQTFLNPLFQSLAGSNHRKGIQIYIDQEPLGAALGMESSKSPQGIRFRDASIQGAEYGFLAYAGETIEIQRAYFEHLNYVVTATGYNLSNQMELLIDYPEFKGGIGSTVVGDGYMIKGGASARIVLRGGHVKTASTGLWVDDGGEIIVVTPPLFVQGLEGWRDDLNSQMVRTRAVSSGVLNLQADRVVHVSAVGSISTIVSDLPPGETITIIASNVNGLGLVSGGNLILPNGRPKMLLRTGDIAVAIRIDTPGFVGWHIRRLEQPRNAIDRGSSFVLSDAYLYTLIRITGSTTVTLPSDAATPGISIGDEFDFLYMGGAVFSFIGGAGATVNAPSSTLTTNILYQRAKALKHNPNHWLVTFLH